MSAMQRSQFVNKIGWAKHQFRGSDPQECCADFSGADYNQTAGRSHNHPALRRFEGSPRLTTLTPQFGQLAA